MRRNAVVLFALAWSAACGPAEAPGPQRVLLAATHTVEDSGLLEHIISGFEAAQPQFVLQVTVSGSGQALELGRRRDVDVLLTHSPSDERNFIEEGYGVFRREVMESDFIVLGPSSDPAGIKRLRDVGEAFHRIDSTASRFVSRGDESGTHRKEQSIWDDVRVTPGGQDYIVAGVGMADALRIASERGAYILADRPTWLVLQSELRLEILSEGDDRLLNTYSVITVRGAANSVGAEAFMNWIVGPDGQEVIRAYGVDAFGRGLFVPIATDNTG